MEINLKEEKKCSACGSVRVNHRLVFFLNLANEFVDKIGYIHLPSFIADKNGKIDNFIKDFVFSFLHFFSIVNYHSEIGDKINGRSKLIWEEAINRGIDMRQIFIFGKPVDFFKAKINNQTFFFQSLPIPPWFSRRGYDWVDDKFIFSRKLEKAGIPSPKTKRILFFKDALYAFNDFKNR